MDNLPKDIVNIISDYTYSKLGDDFFCDISNMEGDNVYRNEIENKFENGTLTDEDIDYLKERWTESYECGAFTHYCITKDEPSYEIRERTHLAFNDDELEDILEEDGLGPEFNFDLEKDNEGKVYKCGKYYVIMVYVAHG